MPSDYRHHTLLSSIYVYTFGLSRFDARSLVSELTKYFVSVQNVLCIIESKPYCTKVLTVK